jgi:methylaspartate mutase epsilon subunit
MKLENKKLTEGQFNKMRKEVLATWHTGKEVDIDEAVEYHKKNMSDRNVVRRLQRARAEGDTLIQPRSGISPIAACIELFKYLQDEGLCDISSTSVDSYTRANRYEDCEEAFQKSEREGRSYLNGLPVVNVGVKKLRGLVEALKNPMELRTSAVDARMSAEVALAAGYSAFIHGPICPTMHYHKNAKLAKACEYYQHLFRLMGVYTEKGVPMAADVFGTFSNVGVPQSFVFANVVIEALAAAAQGVKCVMVNTIMQGNLVQDTASTMVLRGIVEEYLERFGYEDVEVFVVANHWTGPYPADPQAAYAIDALNTVAAVMGGADTMMIKSIDQGVALPSKENNAAALRFTRKMINYLKKQKVKIGGDDLELEKAMTIKETKQLVEKMLEMGDGDPLVGAVNAYEAGVMESPFSSNKNYNHGKVMVARDSVGRCRYYDVGGLPFTKDIIQFHKDRLNQRIVKENREKGDISLISDSILSLSMEYLV